MGCLAWSPGPPLYPSVSQCVPVCPSVSWCHHNYFPSTKHQIPPYLPSPPSNFLQNQTSSMTSGTIWSDLRVVFRQFLPADLVNRFLCKLPVVEVWHCDNHQQLFNLKTELFLNCKCRIIFLSSVSVTEMKYCDLKHVTLSVRCRARSSHHTSTNCYHLTPHTSHLTVYGRNRPGMRHHWKIKLI